VSLPEEIEMVNTYLELEKLRLGNRLTYHIRMPDNADHVRLPGMLIQPLVENAIKHGIAPKVEGGNLKVEVHLDQNRCHILVEDDGVGWDEHSLDDPGHGLENIRERLNLAFEGKHEIKFYNRMGAVIEISFPLEK
jgi:LytS/YehU family sensor histidine kinase